MAATDEPASYRAAPSPPLGPRWRAERERAQEAALPPGKVVVSCSAPFGAGGLGRHLEEIVQALDRRGPPATCLCGPTQGSAPTPANCTELHVSGLATSVRRLGRISPSIGNWRHNFAYDRYAARRLPQGEHLIAFNSQALAQLRAAKRAPWKSACLLSANSHMRRLARRHDEAHRAYPLEGSWARMLVGKNIKEYAQADRIYVASRYTWESFVEEGVDEERLVTFPFTPHPRYGVEREPNESSTFDLVFAGRLIVSKGVPLLVDAMRRLPYEDLRLVLVGGWSRRGMRKYLQEACARDDRIVVGPGDPLAKLRQARLCVHPSYEDGFAYAPAEAMACGVPVLVSEDTGMKELIEPGVDGVILPTGDLAALTEAIDAAYRGEILAG